MTPGVSALFVRADGPYPGLVADWWDETRDARRYAGPNRVVAHPPCTRWCQLAGVVEARYGYKRGEDGGCFASALASARGWGGVLEHPAFSRAWPTYGLPDPPAGGGWQREMFGPGWVCEVSQAAYGHRARKLTWLYYVGPTPPALDWSRPEPTATVSFMTNHGGGDLPRLSKREANESPLPFAQLLVSLAATAVRVAA